MIVAEIIRTMSRASDYLDGDALKETRRFITSRWNRDGGVQGRDGKSDLYYTAFAAICTRALRGRLPLLRLWCYLRSFGDGASLDIVHLFCLIRLHSIFPMTQGTRNRLMTSLASKSADSASDLFFKVVMAEYLKKEDRPEAELAISDTDVTSNIAAAIVINNRPDKDAEAILMQRYCETGGFCESASRDVPDLYSTVTALFALHVMDVDLTSVRNKTLELIDSLRSGTGGYTCRTKETLSDTECTFYALLAIGCLMQ